MAYALGAVAGGGSEALVCDPPPLPKILFLTLRYILAKNLRADSKDLRLSGHFRGFATWHLLPLLCF